MAMMMQQVTENSRPRPF